MGIPGEIPQEIGRAYVQLLVGCLERTIPCFHRTFEVHEAPWKLTFGRPSCTEFSFDVLGIYDYPFHKCEVLIESKGHQDGNAIFSDYREFLAKAYVTSAYQRQTSDLFWFVTNVPFGSSIGRRLTSPSFIRDALIDKPGEKVAAILGPDGADPSQIPLLSDRVSVCIFTDSFMRRMGAYYKVKQGDNLWSIVSLLHANRLALPEFENVAERIASVNNLDNPNNIHPGQSLEVPWYGIEWN